MVIKSKGGPGDKRRVALSLGSFLYIRKYPFVLAFLER